MEICLIDAEGLDEEIRCEMCRNPMRSDTGCDGGCTYDEKLYEKIVHLLNERIKPLPNIKPERKTGMWVSVGCVVPSIANVPMIKCTVCGHLEPDVDAARTPYCSHCGSRMKEG